MNSIREPLVLLQQVAADPLEAVKNFWLPIVLVLAGYALLILINYFTTRNSRTELSERERELRQRVRSMETTVNILSKEVERRDGEIRDNKDLIEEQAKEIASLRTLVQESEQKQKALQEKVLKLEGELRAKNVIETKTSLVVLGIWPEPPAGDAVLNQQGEKDALYNAGFSFVELSGDSANVDGVVREMDRSSPRILEIGCHDDGNGNPVLSDGVTEPGWWADVVTDHDILLVVLLYCRSNQQDRLNVSDALLRAGVQNVISFNKPVADVQAIKFSRLLYQKLSEGMPIDRAVLRAKLVVNRATRDMIRLRTK